MAANETKSPEHHARRPAWPTRIVQPQTAQRCARHRHVDAFVRCDRCQMQWCESCVQRRDDFGHTYWICSCAGRASRLPETLPAEERAKRRWLGHAIAEPLQASAIRLVLAGTVCYGALDWWVGSATRGALGHLFRGVTGSETNAAHASTASAGLLVSAMGIALFLVVLGYQFAWFLQVVRDSARGRPAFESFPEFSSLVDSVMLPALQGFAAAAATIGPGLLAMTAGPLPPWIGGTIALAGFLVLPMALASIASDGSLRGGLDPLRIAQGVRACGVEYALAALLFVAMCATVAAGTWFFDALGHVGPFARAFVILTTSGMAANVLGAMLARHEPELRWQAGLPPKP